MKVKEWRMIPGFGTGKTYRPISICFPLGFGIEKAMNNDMGLKLEAGFRYTHRLFR